MKATMKRSHTGADGTQTGMHDKKIKEFIEELNGFAATAEQALKAIESDLEKNKGLFSIFYERMFAIRGTAQQLNLDHIVPIARLGEEISVKATQAQKRAQIRRCVSGLWDALTTVKYLIEHYTEETTEEQNILKHRLEEVVRVLGGPREKVSGDDIDAILNSRK